MSVDYNTIKSLGLAQSSAQASKKNELGQDMFMKLMVTQLKNQNPLKPQDGAEFLSQLAQFSTVSGIQDLQKSFSGFASAMNEDQALQAANLVGKSVLIPSAKGILGAGADDKIEGELTLPNAATNVTVRILDRSSSELRTIDLGAQGAGQVPFDWDGLLEGGMRANPGLYTIKAEAQIDGKTMALDTQVRAPIESVKLGGAKGIEIDLGVLGRYALKDVREIL
jgi:flagellar basal-body rod modification protein FlgD